MADPTVNEVAEAIRMVQARMMRHSFEHLPSGLDPRTAMIVVKNSLLQSIPASPIPEDIVKVIEDPRHDRRWAGSIGPFIVLKDGKTITGVVEVRSAFLNPELRLRRAAFDELTRQIVQHSGNHDPIVSPQTRRRIEELRESILSEDLRESLSATIEATDLLSDDYFYNLAGVRQCAILRLDSELTSYFEHIVGPNEQTIQFLMQLPVWSPYRQRADIERLRSHIVESMPTLNDVLIAYFLKCGHLPLAGDDSLAGVVRAWLTKHEMPSDLWGDVWAWARANGSPLACYHACQLFAGTVTGSQNAIETQCSRRL